MKNHNALFDLMVDICRADAARFLPPPANLPVISDEEKAEALADQPDDWQPTPTAEEINRYAAILDEVISEGRTFPHRNNFKE